ncbi:MAG TPA: ankyrin repeat domain-containing protein [Elusimicrobiota bacterium]|jgi:hypothetical protein|nr:ankyrin repeat domain-containing protein [Elusimicrobiota bacterium]
MSTEKPEASARALTNPVNVLPLVFGVLAMLAMWRSVPLRAGGHFFPPMLVGNVLMLLLWISYAAALRFGRARALPFSRSMSVLCVFNIAIGAWGVSVQLDAAKLNREGLWRAAEMGDARHVEFLLSRGMADPDARDEKGRTALMRAALAGQVLTSQALLRFGARADLTDKDGRTALLLAREALHAEAAALFQGGAPPQTRRFSPPAFLEARFQKTAVSRLDGRQRLLLRIHSEAGLDAGTFWVGFYSQADQPASGPGCGANEQVLRPEGADAYSVDIDVNRCFPASSETSVVHLGYFNVFDRAGNALRVGKEVGRRFVFPRRVEFRVLP